MLKYRIIPTKFAEEKNILKKNHDVTIMTPSGHVASPGTCQIDRPLAISYRLSI